MKSIHWPATARLPKQMPAIRLAMWAGIVLLATISCQFTVDAWAQEFQPSVQDNPLDSITPEDQPPQDLAAAAAAEAEDNEVVYKEKGLNLLDLLWRGGWFMIPLAILSIVVVALGIERWFALREEKVLPKQLIRELGMLSRAEEGFDPRLAFRACQAHPSAASRVLRVMLLKAGRPQSEVENAVAEAAEREATRLQATVSWLTLAAAVAPLIGLLGTVWGMIQAFYDTTQLVAGQNKAEVLAQGIYTALVTTLSGLLIAIPSAVLAHFYDNRIVGWFHKIEELAASLTPMMEQFEGQMRATVDDQWSDPAKTSSEHPAATARQDVDVVAPPSPR